MKLTPAILRQCYELLRETPPFDRWRLPSGDQVQFVVMPGSKQFGDFTRLKHRQRIRVWAGMHARLSRVIETVAHEMCHMKQRSHAATKNSATHGPAFQKLANQVCRHHPDFERRYECSGTRSTLTHVFEIPGPATFQQPIIDEMRLRPPDHLSVTPPPRPTNSPAGAGTATIARAA